ncbi:hypothetical protein CK203_053161 [Vitis vinifera]|uniref:Reverse transcriptase zinc-binding domain-containing protein n=1 Tax=Vitis vinifera TaxID=29760 RepID=A0A438GP34_VITVI|nr:hypothetical protein CK203_053161 [Vitis vinifera]
MTADRRPTVVPFLERILKGDLKEYDRCWDNMVFLAGKGTKIRFWKDIWCTDTPLSHCFPHLFVMAMHRDATIEEMWDQNSGLLWREDSVLWRRGRNGYFRVKEAYSLLANPNDTVFPSKCIWVDRVPSKVAFFTWEATWGRCSLWTSSN